MHSTPNKPVNPESLKEGYEVTDIKPSIIITLLAVVTLTGAAAFVIIVALINRFDETRKPYNDTPRSPVAQPLDQVPPFPHLQQNPRADAMAYVTSSAAHLNSYGLVEETGSLKVAHIPIDAAIKKVATGELPYRSTPKIAELAPAPPAEAQAQ